MSSFKNKNSRLDSVNDTDGSSSTAFNKSLPDFDSITQATLNDYKSLIKQVKTKLEKFTASWNADENNRDKTYKVFNELKDTKQEI